MEVVDIPTYMNIIKRIENYLISRTSGKLTIILKIYASSYSNPEYRPVELIARFFDEAYLCSTRWTSSFSSELYLYAHSKNMKYREESQHVEMHSVKQGLLTARALCSESEEFSRALGLNLDCQKYEAPERMIPEPRNSLHILLRHTKISAEVLDLIDESFRNSIQDLRMIKLSTLLVLLTIIWNRHFQISLLKGSRHYPPSLPEAGELMSITLGILLFIARKTSNLQLFELAHHLFNHQGIIYYTLVCQTLKKTGKTLHCIEWSFSKISTNGLGYFGNLSSSKAASWIRCLSTITGDHIPIGSNGYEASLEEHDNLASKINKRLQLRWTGYKTGLDTIWKILFRNDFKPFSIIKRVQEFERADGSGYTDEDFAMMEDLETNWMLPDN